jgi:type IV pilus assembly protein PilQ
MVMRRLKYLSLVRILVPVGLGVLISSICISAIPEDEPISMDFQDADIKTVLRSFSVYTDKNIIAGPEVEGPVTVHLEEVPWRKALDIVLRANGYGAREEEGIIRVGLWDQFLNEEIKRNEAERKREDLEPLVTKIVDVSFAKADEITEPLKPLLSRRGVIEVDSRTNAVIVSDIEPKTVEIAKMVRALDNETPQVEINAKLVDVDARISRDLGIQWTAEGVKVPGLQGEHGAKLDATGQLQIDPTQTQQGAALSQPEAELTIGKVIGPAGSFEATLQALERDNKANIISNPRITTLNNRQASIIVGKKIPLIVTDEAGNPITQLTTVGIQMQVTPHVNSKTGEITMDLHPEVSDLSAQATVQGGIIIVTSEADTRVMVQNGQTAVIGGLIRTNESIYNVGIPLLRDLPVIGRLFGSKSKVEEQRELLIFVTPTIVE